MECPKCGYRLRRENARYCSNCGFAVFLGGSHQTGSKGGGGQVQGNLANLAEENFERARKIAKEKGINTNANPENITAIRQDLLTMASYLRLSMQQPSTYYANASSLLAVVMFLLRDADEAKKYAEIALSNDRHNFTAWDVKIIITSKTLANYNPEGDTSTFAGAIITGALIGYKKGNMIRDVRLAAKWLANAFTYNAQSTRNADVREWVYMAERLIAVGDILYRCKVYVPEIYQAIITAPWHQVALGVFENKVKDLVVQAQGFLLLYKDAEKN